MSRQVCFMFNNVFPNLERDGIVHCVLPLALTLDAFVRNESGARRYVPYECILRFRNSITVRKR